MRYIRALENHRLRSELVQIRRVNLYASVASERIRALLIGKEQYQVRLSLCGHVLVRSRTKSALAIGCNRSVAVAVSVLAPKALFHFKPGASPQDLIAP